MKCKRRIAAVCISAVLGCSALPAAALEPPAVGLQPVESVELSALAESEIEVHLKNETPLATETTYDNLQTFIAKAREQSNASDAEIAKTLLCRIGSADLAESYTVEQLSEVLNYAEIVRSTVYYRVSRDGTKTPVTAQEAVNAKGRALVAASSNLWTSWETSDDGYMQIYTQGIRLNEQPSYSGDARNRYFKIATRAEWLLQPHWGLEDLQVLSFGSAILDTRYESRAHLYRYDKCSHSSHYSTRINSWWHYRSNTVDRHEGEDAASHVNILYPSGSAIAARVKFGDLPSGYGCYHTDTDGFQKNYLQMDTATSYLETQVYLQAYDSPVHAGYSHKRLGGDIGISIGTGGAGFSFTGAILRTDYYGQTIVLEYN